MDFSFLKKMEGVHLLVAGEVGIDEYIWGDTRRISPEAPVPVVEVDSETYNVGLAANVAQNIVSLGGKATLVTVRGIDPDGEKLAEMIADRGVQHSVFVTDPSRPTLRKVRIIDNGECGSINANIPGSKQSKILQSKFIFQS